MRKRERKERREGERGKRAIIVFVCLILCVNFFLSHPNSKYKYIQGWYCKRPKSACPLHYEKDQMLGENVTQICGFRRNEEESPCLELKKKCDKHNNWELIRRVELCQEEVWLKICLNRVCCCSRCGCGCGLFVLFYFYLINFYFIIFFRLVIVHM